MGTTLDPTVRTSPAVLDTPPVVTPAAAPASDGQVPPVPTGSYQLEPSFHPQIRPFTPTAPGNGGATPTGETFADYVDGQKSQPIDVELMQIANAVYDPGVGSVGNWTRVSDAELIAAGLDPAEFETPDTGFRAGLFTDGDGNYVLGFSGSNATWQDWVKTNFAQGLGLFAEQYDQAPALLEKVANSTLGDPTGQSTLREREALVTVGHSLGGGLAATAALVTDIPAVTFDASGVHDNTLRDLGLDPAAAFARAEGGLIRRFNVDGDPLTAAQEDVWGLNNIPDAPGFEITLDDPLPPIKAPEWTWNPIEMGKRTAEYVAAKAERVADLHRQGTMIEALQEQRPWEA